MRYNKYVKNEYDPKINEKIGQIIKIEWEITEAIQKGHRSHIGDQYKEKRIKAETLRKELGLR